MTIIYLVNKQKNLLDKLQIKINFMIQKRNTQGLYKIVT